MDLKEIEFWEREYLEQIYYLLSIDMDKLMEGLETKEFIRDDWEDVIKGKSLSEIAIGSERIFYWLFNQFGIPNSSPVGSDLFFETYNAFVHIDIKTVTKSNVISDFYERIIIGKNQNSYSGKIIKNDGTFKENYSPNLPPFYHENEENKKNKICLTYFIVILNEEEEKNILSIILTCMPNGRLAEYYENENNLKINDRNNKVGILAPGKNDGEARFRYALFRYFELLDKPNLRTKILYWDKKITEDVDLQNHFELLHKIYNEQQN